MTDLKELYTQRREKFLIPLAEELEKFLKDCLHEQPRVDRICARAKTVDSFLKKALKEERETHKYDDPLNQIQDQIGVRIITFYNDDVETVAREAESYLRHIEQRKVFPESESEFGYFGKHYIMLLPKDVTTIFSGDDYPPFFELQIKTLFQHAWSEANHDLGYKSDKNLSSEKRRKLAFSSAQAWGADMVFNELNNEINS